MNRETPKNLSCFRGWRSGNGGAPRNAKQKKSNLPGENETEGLGFGPCCRPIGSLGGHEHLEGRKEEKEGGRGRYWPNVLLLKAGELISQTHGERRARGPRVPGHLGGGR